MTEAGAREDAAKPSGKRRAKCTSALEELRGVGPAIAARLEAAGFSAATEIARFVPRALRAYRRPATLEASLVGELVEVEVVGLSVTRSRRRGVVVTDARFRLADAAERVDDERSVQLSCRFFGPYWLADGVETADGERKRYVLRGKLGPLERFAWRLDAVELLRADRVAKSDAELRYVPRYARVDKVGPRQLQNVIASALDHAVPIEDEDPEVLADLGLPTIGAALRELHDPSADVERHERARRRVALTEARELLAGVRERRERREGQRAHALPASAELLERVEARLPHALTADQRGCLDEVLDDLARDRPMARLLQGDVGSGKTMIALASALVAVAGGTQAILLAPTSLLAEQHFERMQGYLEGSRLPVHYYAHRLDARARRAVRDDLASSRPCLVVGTHALLGRGIRAGKLGLLVIDEQHRFGVRQRGALFREVEGRRPHVLVMSATPIPRTQATALFGDLDLTELRSMPFARPKLETRVVAPESWDLVKREISAELARGGRVYVVCPRIGSDVVEPGSDMDADAVHALATHRELSRAFPVGLVHGRQKREVRERAQRDFASGRVSCLVATTLIEVGVDVPEATWMVVRGADRLGLSSLHQLRGRVGRGRRGGACILVGQPDNERLRLLESCADGFALAEADLRERGQGELTGRRQHGHGRFRCLDPVRDLDLMRAAAASTHVSKRASAEH